jgi:hypothetical protein
MRFRNQLMRSVHLAAAADPLRDYPPFQQFMRPRG